MKKTLIILIALVVIISGLGYFRLATDTEPSPKISIVPQAFDFGQVKYGDVVQATFKLKNDGGSDLEIVRVSTSCGCTKAEVNKNTVAPAEEITLIVFFDPAVHEDDTDLGEVTRIIYVKSNDPTTPEAEVKIMANVYKE